MSEPSPIERPDLRADPAPTSMGCMDATPSVNPYAPPSPNTGIYLGDQPEITAEGDVVFQMTARELARGYAVGLRRHVFRNLAVSVLCGFALTAVGLFQLVVDRGSWSPALLGGGIALILLPVLTISAQKRQIAKMYRDLGIDDEEIRLRNLGAHGIEIILEKQRAILDRDNIVKTKETTEFLLLFRSATVIHVLPKDRLGEEMVTAIRSYFRIA